MKTLVIAELVGTDLAVSSYHGIVAARELVADADILLTGHEISAAAEKAAAIPGVAAVLVVDKPHLAHQLAEEVAPVVAELAGNYSHVVMASTTTCKDILPRAAALIGTGMISDVTAIVSADTFERPVYAGNAVETVLSSAQVKFLSVRASAFPVNNAETAQTQAPLRTVDWQKQVGLSEFIRLQAAASERPDLSVADIVVSGGRGLGSKEKFALIEQLADKLGAAIGASRAAVDAGFISNDHQVGQTGKIVAPRLYIAVGISGAVQHLAGMKDAGVIVAINKDPEAPIFDIADYALVGDLFEILPELIAKLP